MSRGRAGRYLGSTNGIKGVRCTAYRQLMHDSGVRAKSLGERGRERSASSADFGRVVIQSDGAEATLAPSATVARKEFKLGDKTGIQGDDESGQREGLGLQLGTIGTRVDVNIAGGYVHPFCPFFPCYCVHSNRFYYRKPCSSKTLESSSQKSLRDLLGQTDRRSSD